ncbi:MAG TPA: ABATE domain-containing protein [Thermoanaerobaculia bacterium]|jgi:predicted RNA-binding Zn ribbon-like protein
MARKRGKQDGRPALVKRDGALALTFVNTGSRRSRRLRDYADLLAWSVQQGALTAADASRLGELAAERPRDAAAGFAVAEELHALLSRVFNGLADRQAPTAEAVRELNALWERIVPRSVLAAGATRLQWTLPDEDRDVYRPLRAVALSASAVLTSNHYGKVRRCAREGCDVLFLANRHGLPRKWCDDRTCGAPLRSKQYYLRVTKPERKAAEEEWKRNLRRRRNEQEPAGPAAE